MDDAAAALGRTPELLVQVDMAGEATKFGAPEETVPAIFEAAESLRAARLVGLMLLPPFAENPGGRPALVPAACANSGTGSPRRACRPRGFASCPWG